MFIERETVPSVPDKVSLIPDTIDIPEEFEAQEGVKAVNQTQNLTNISNTGNIQTAKDDSVTVTIPSDPQTLHTQAKKGKITDAATWLALFWYRTFKKALHFGWKVVQK